MPDESELFYRVLQEFGPTLSGIRFEYAGIFPPISPLKQEDDDIAGFLALKTNTAYLALQKKLAAGKFRQLIENDMDFKQSQKHKGVGGIGVTSRGPEELEKEIPWANEILSLETGKIAFLGNGFSSVPLIYAKKYEEGKLSHPPIILDCFDYTLAREDFISFKIHCEQYDLPLDPRYARCFDNLFELCSEIQNKNLIPVNYFFGQNDVPRILEGTELAVNCHGPPASSLDEQLSILRVGGELCTNNWLTKDIIKTIEPNFLIYDIKDWRTGTIMANIIRRQA